MKNLEIIAINTVDGKLVATVSYQDPAVTDLNNGYTTVEAPINIRELQLSSRGNILVDQSVKNDSVAAGSGSVIPGK